MTPITFHVAHLPIAQPRAKATMRGRHASVYNPDRVKTATGTKPHPVVEFKYAVRQAAIAAMVGRGPFDGAVCLSWVAVFPRPQRLLKKSSPQGRIPHIAKPDRDNLDKAICDALKGLVLSDDCVVWDGRLTKVYAAIGEATGVTVTVTDCSGLS